MCQTKTNEHSSSSRRLRSTQGGDTRQACPQQSNEDSPQLTVKGKRQQNYDRLTGLAVSEMPLLGSINPSRAIEAPSPIEQSIEVADCVVPKGRGPLGRFEVLNVLHPPEIASSRSNDSQERKFSCALKSHCAVINLTDFTKQRDRPSSRRPGSARQAGVWDLFE